jgi:hypothetical protein
MKMKNYIFSLFFISLLVFSSCKRESYLSLNVDLDEKTNIVYIEYDFSESTALLIKNKENEILFKSFIEAGKGILEIDIENYEKGDYMIILEKSNSSFIAFTKK